MKYLFQMAAATDDRLIFQHSPERSTENIKTPWIKTELKNFSSEVLGAQDAQEELKEFDTQMLISTLSHYKELGYMVGHDGANVKQENLLAGETPANSAPLIYAVQKALVKIGIPVAVDGWLGNETKEALKGIQREAGYNAQGIIGKLTMQLLIDKLEANNEPVVEEEPAQRAPYVDGFEDVVISEAVARQAKEAAEKSAITQLEFEMPEVKETQVKPEELEVAEMKEASDEEILNIFPSDKVVEAEDMIEQKMTDIDKFGIEEDK